MALAIVLVLAAATAASVAAERAVLSVLQHRQLVQVHAANWVQGFPNESYENVSNLAKQLEDDTDKLKEKLEGDLEKRSQDSERSANDYGALLTGLSDGLHAYGRNIDDFRALEQQRHRRHTEEVRKVLTGKERAATGKSEQPEAQHDEVAVAETSSTTEVEEEVTTPEAIQEEEPTSQHETEDEEDKSELDTEDEAETPEVSKDDTKAAEDKLAALNDGDFAANLQDDTKVEEAADALKKLEGEVQRKQKVLQGCFDLMGDPVESKRTCKSSFDKDYCDGREPKAACKKAKECVVKYVCKSKDNSISSADGSWKIEDNQAACGDQQMEAKNVCVPKAGGYRLPFK